jgi:small subunit ribosomal protein S7
MARRKRAIKRENLPDPLFGSVLLAKFVNVFMSNGKKSIAEKMVYGALQMVAEKKLKDKATIYEDEKVRTTILELFEKALGVITPTVEVRSCRIGGATYQVPVEVKTGRGLALAMRWLVEAANTRNEKGMVLRLSGEILDILEERGGAVKKREDVHKMAKANQAFAHYRWS